GQFSLIPIDEFIISILESEGGSVSGAGVYEEGEEVTRLATPDTGWEFEKWVEVNGEYTSNPLIFIAESNRELQAIFTEIPPTQYYISVGSTGSGTTTGSGFYNEGSSVTLEAFPNAGYMFDGWEYNSEIVSTDNPWVFNAEEDISVTAKFSEIIPDPTKYTVTVIQTSGGTVTGGGEYDEGDIVTITATPQLNYEFIRWSDDTNINPYIFEA